MPRGRAKAVKTGSWRAYTIVFVMSDQISFVAECPGCGKDAVQKHYVVSLRTLLEREGLKMYCQFCDASWKASADDRCRVAALVSQQKVVAKN